MVVTVYKVLTLLVCSETRMLKLICSTTRSINTAFVIVTKLESSMHSKPKGETNHTSSTASRVVSAFNTVEPSLLLKVLYASNRGKNNKCSGIRNASHNRVSRH